MAKGIKTGGREKGTPNRERKDLLEMLSEKYPGYHPVMAMAAIANDKKADESLKFHANKEIAKYVCPQLKATSTEISFEQLSDEDIDRLIKELMNHEP